MGGVGWDAGEIANDTRKRPWIWDFCSSRFCWSHCLPSGPWFATRPNQVGNSSVPTGRVRRLSPGRRPLALRVRSIGRTRCPDHKLCERSRSTFPPSMSTVHEESSFGLVRWRPSLALQVRLRLNELAVTRCLAMVTCIQSRLKSTKCFTAACDCAWTQSLRLTHSNGYPRARRAIPCPMPTASQRLVSWQRFRKKITLGTRSCFTSFSSS